MIVQQYYSRYLEQILRVHLPVLRSVAYVNHHEEYEQSLQSGLRGIGIQGQWS